MLSIDDIVVTGKTEQEHLQNLQKTLDRLKSAGFRIRVEKRKFSSRAWSI